MSPLPATGSLLPTWVDAQGESEMPQLHDEWAESGYHPTRTTPARTPRPRRPWTYWLVGLLIAALLGIAAAVAVWLFRAQRVTESVETHGASQPYPGYAIGDAALALPQMNGSGMVRNLRAAMSLAGTQADELEAAVAAFSAATARDGQRAGWACRARAHTPRGRRHGARLASGA